MKLSSLTFPALLGCFLLTGCGGDPENSNQPERSESELELRSKWKQLQVRDRHQRQGDVAGLAEVLSDAGYATVGDWHSSRPVGADDHDERATRFGGLKQTAPIGPNGETMLDYSVFDAIRAGFGKVAFVIRKDFEAQFREAVGSRFEDRIEVTYAFQSLDDVPSGFTVPAERAKPWGTGHAVYAAREVVKEPCAVINADDFYGAPMRAIVVGWVRPERDFAGLDELISAIRTDIAFADAKLNEPALAALASDPYLRDWDPEEEERESERTAS